MKGESVGKDLEKFVKRYRVKPGSKFRVSDWDADEKKLAEGGKEEGLAEMEELNAQLEEMQELLYANGQHKVLIVLQGMDTSGKDGTIRHVFEGVNPIGVKVASFKVPSEHEQAHDFLWRIHQQVPGKGEMTIFNRSHYEDVLVVRVYDLVPKDIWRQRYEQINNFEKMLAESGTIILKFYLHVSKDEQKKRLEERLADPHKNWKFRVGDLKDRERWDDYLDAYEDAIGKTSTDHAPWFVIPSNSKWYRNLVTASIIVRTLEDLKMTQPGPEEGLSDVVVK